MADIKKLKDLEKKLAEVKAQNETIEVEIILEDHPMYNATEEEWALYKEWLEQDGEEVVILDGPKNT